MTRTEKLEVPLLSGVPFPDWSVVTSDEVRASLTDTLERLRMTRRWGGMTQPEEAVRRAIINHYVILGHAPPLQNLAEVTGVSRAELPHLLQSLEERDLIVLSKSGHTPGQKIEAAYPFTDRKSEHRIRIGDVNVKAMCAIDALGVGAMINQNTVIQSRCRHCGCEIRIETKNKGRAITSHSPEKAVVWSGYQDRGGSAADTHCTVMAFFCSDDHLSAWRHGNDVEPRGHRLSMEQGLEAGAALFIPFLATDQTAVKPTN